MRIAWLVLCLVAAVGHAAGRPPLKLDTGDGLYELTAFEQRSGTHHYFGAYASPYALTGGTALHLFPNGRFVVAEFVDIAPDVVTARGTYEVRGTSLLLHFSFVKPGHEDLRQNFADLHVAWGWQDKGNYVQGFEVFVISGDAWQQLSAGKSDVRYMRRTVSYNDWQRVLREYDAR